MHWCEIVRGATQSEEDEQLRSLGARPDAVCVRSEAN